MPRKQRPEVRANYSRKYNSAPQNREKIRARDILHYAVRTGEVAKQPCAKCGAPNAQAHHPDYSKPLDVIWLCQPCHGLEHTGGFCARGHARTPDNVDSNHDCRRCKSVRARLAYQRKTSAATNPMFDNDRLIDAAGRVDHAFVKASARARAQSLYGAACTDLDIAYWEDRVMAMAIQQAALFGERAAPHSVFAQAAE